MIHLPHINKAEGIRRTEVVMKTHNFGSIYPNNILVDHNTEETIEKTLELGFWAGLSVYPNTKLSPARAIKIIQKHGVERIMVNSAADWGISDPLSVPLVAKEMRKKGLSTEKIESVTFHNALEFFKRSPKFTWQP